MVRTITTVAYLFDALPELLGDRRIQILFTQNGEDSAFEAGVADAVRALGGRMLPWEQAVATRFDLAISASHYGGLDRLRSPLLILPHGPGYTKTISRPDDGLAPRPGLAPADEPTPATTVMLSHEDQRAQWQANPAAGVQTVVIGDPVFDRLEASMSERERYRHALGLKEGRKLVAISSTWGPSALLAARPSLASDLLAELPADEYAVVALLHSNIWVGHGQWQLRLWLGRALEAGLRLIPYDDGSWRSALVASDLLIGDHGSVTLYGATLGIPVALGAFGEEEAVAGTPVATLGRNAPRLDLRGRLRQQLESIGFGLDADRHADLTAAAFANRGRALAELRGVVYRLLGLEPPSQPVRVTAAPAPRAEGRAATAFLAVGRVAEGGDGGDAGAEITLERFPAALEPAHAAANPGRHLLVLADEPDRALRESAAAIVRPGTAGGAPGSTEEARDWATAVLAAYPGCRVAAAATGGGTGVIVDRDRPPLTVELEADADIAPLTSAVYIWLCQATADADPPAALSVSLGARSLTVEIRTGLPQLEPT